MQRQPSLFGDEPDVRPKWLNSLVTSHRGSLAEVRQHIPCFERRAFALAGVGSQPSGPNARLDAVVRLPFGQDLNAVPVGVVSKEYALVPHTEVIDVATKALEAEEVVPSGVRADLRITEYGERMALSLYLSEEHQFDPGDGNPMALRLECYNSVDGSSRLQILMTWDRLVCGNGLIVGTTSGFRRRHVGGLGLGDIADVLRAGLAEACKDAENLRLWRRKATPDDLSTWIETSLREAWGFKAATRAYHIARSGCDVAVAGQYKDSKPTSIAVRTLAPVPGAPPQCRSLFDLSQILAWLAKERRDVQEQVEWREMIPSLMQPLLN
ncbi:MAG: DUF945 domain-containing protein [Lentisphaerae bacterium]|nr:DUF945 domain-containing protein [Lentisphaerota bacterium]